MKNYKIFFLTIFILLSQVKSILSKDIIAFGTPMIKIESGFESTNRSELNESQRSQYVVAIEFDGKDFRWKTRENKVLEYSTKGAFHYFVNKEGSGYVKIGDLSKMGGAEKKYLYIEHVHLGFSTITY